MTSSALARYRKIKTRIRVRQGLCAVFLLVILFNLFVTRQSSVGNWQEKGWAFDHLPHLLFQTVRQPTIIASLLGLYAIRLSLNLAVSEGMFRTYRMAEPGPNHTKPRQRAAQYLWLLQTQTMMYPLFGILALALYVPSFFIWRSYSLDLSVGILVLGGLVYPLFYGLSAVAAMVSVFPIPDSERFQLLLSCVAPSSRRQFWVFYLMRIGAELFLLTAIPYVALTVFHNRVVALVSAGVGLTLPLVLVRGAAYVLTLRLFQPNESLNGLFGSAVTPVEKAASGE